MGRNTFEIEVNQSVFDAIIGVYASSVESRRAAIQIELTDDSPNMHVGAKLVVRSTTSDDVAMAVINWVSAVGEEGLMPGWVLVGIAKPYYVLPKTA